MKKIIFLVIFLFGLGVGLLYRSQIISIATNFVLYSPCDTPIAYSIGTIDSRFNVSAEDLISDAKIAANIWSTTQNKQLFVYDPKSTFTINMVYDSRQALTSQIDKLNSNLKQQQGTIDPQIAAFKLKQADFEKRVTALNDQIKYWNGKGGAPKDEYDKLIAEQKQLKDEAATLNATAKSLGQSTQEYNASAQQLNQTIGDYKNVLQYKPEEGLYEQDGPTRRISLYIDVGQDEFVHTLTHEMGHALGLNHNQDSKSIMYPQTTNTLAPSPEDISDLNQICMKRTIFEIAYTRLKEVVMIVKERLSTGLN